MAVVLVVVAVVVTVVAMVMVAVQVVVLRLVVSPGSVAHLMVAVWLAVMVAFGVLVGLVRLSVVVSGKWQVVSGGKLWW